jgi:Fe-S-cluster containining protein
LSSPSRKNFWSEGIRFECQGSGKCCVSRDDYGYVYLSLADQKRFAKYFKLSLKDFRKKYCERTEGFWHLTNPTSACQFLQDKRCTVYEARPTQCRTWPFWPENMKAKVWNEEVASFCPGVGKGRLYSAKEIKGIMEECPELLSD